MGEDTGVMTGSNFKRCRGGVPLFAVFLVLLPVVVIEAWDRLDEPDAIHVDMRKWHRRDWRKCESATRIAYVEDAVHIVSESSGGLFWQIPTLRHGPMDLDAARYPWLLECKRPPLSFNKEIRKHGYDDFIDVEKYPYISWRWKVDYSTIDEQRVRKDGKLEKGHDDFPAKIGVTILKKGSNTIREVAYVWSNTLPDALMFKTETSIIPRLWKMHWRRFVAESGLERSGEWVLESRNLYEDFKKGYPGEEPGKVLRIYLQTDSDNTKRRASGWYGDILFHKAPVTAGSRD